MALNKIVKNSITGDAIDATKVADDAISEEHLDVTAITGNTELSATAADDDVLLVFDTSAGTIKKIAKSNIALAAPTFSSVSPTSLLSGDGTGNHTIVITGTKFDATATFKIKTNGGTDIAMDSVTRNSATQLTGVVAKNTANLTNANEPFDIIITNSNGLAITTTNQINIDASPAYVTAAGTLGSIVGGSAMTAKDIVATDPESAGNVSFEFQSGALPAGLSSATVNENGVSKFRISGTPTNPGANTTTNFVLRAVDAASNTTSRAFSLTVTRTVTTESFTSTGTFSVPAGVSQTDVLVVAGGGSGSQGASAGGGGGAGGLIFFPDYPVTASGTIVVTVGDAGASSNTNIGNDGQDSVFGTSPSPGLGQGGVLTAKGGGGGGFGNPGASADATNKKPGGSGGGAGRDSGSKSGSPYAGVGIQPTQSGNSGAYGFGFPGGSSQAGGWSGAGGGGGAGAAGANGTGPTSSYQDTGGNGGIGKAYTIADGTSSVYYAGGGGGVGSLTSGTGGQGGGGPATLAYAPPSGVPTPNSGQSVGVGTANRGGGGGAGGQQITSGAGGKGIVIVRY